MDNAAYATLTRQSGLKAELQALANNIANASTTGFRREGVVFAEYVTALENADTSLSMARAEGRYTDQSTGAHRATGGNFDFAILGDGYFQIQTDEGVRLTRAGAFAPDGNGDLVTPEGHRLLDAGGAPIPIPPGASQAILSDDGTLSIDGFPVTQLGLVMPNDLKTMVRVGDTGFKTEAGTTPLENPQIIQGFLEASNVDPISEITRLIEVQRVYERGSKFLGHEDERIRAVIKTLGSS